MLRDRARERARERLEQRFDVAPAAAHAAPTRDAAAAADQSEFDQEAISAIPAEVRMISGCHDKQTSADVSNVSTFQLPDVPSGTAGGALTSSILNIVYEEDCPSDEKLSFVDVFLRTRELVQAKGFTQIPQLSSSRMIDVNRPFDLMTNKYGGSGGTRRAVLIGINYERHRQGRLRGCHNDVRHIAKYITEVGGIKDENVTILMDDGGNSIEPTRENVMEALDDLVHKCQPGDTAFVHYSGHGGRVRDETGQDPTGYNSTLCPVDFDRAGQILDKELYQHLVCAMPKGTALTCLMDCCHSGTVLDLPYNFVADGEQTDMVPDLAFPFQKLQALRRAFREAGVRRVRDLRDEETRERLKDALADENLEVDGSRLEELRKRRQEHRRF